MAGNIVDLFHKDKIHGGNKTEECCYVVPVQWLSLKKHVGNNGKHYKGDAFLDDFQLNKRERTAITLEPNPVGRHLTTVFKECYSPGEHNDPYQRPVTRHTSLLKTQVPVPCKCHKDVAEAQKKYCINSVHNRIIESWLSMQISLPHPAGESLRWSSAYSLLFKFCLAKVHKYLSSENNFFVFL